MHGYLYAICKTPKCPGKLYVAHIEFPDTDSPMTFIDYPDQWFPVATYCGSCRHTHRYAVKEIRTEISPTATHPPQWRPIFDAPLPKPRDTN